MLSPPYQGFLLGAVLLFAGGASCNNGIETNLTFISTQWGQISPYTPNDPSYFGVQDIGLPDGCGVEQVHVLHRHGQRYPTGSPNDSPVMTAFVEKVGNSSGPYTGPLSFLKNYTYELGTSLLTVPGTVTEFKSGADFWVEYGRLLYDAVPGQNAYNETFVNGTSRPKPVLRTTSQARILQSAEFWAEGFFGLNASSKYDLVVIAEGGTENDTLASYDVCYNDNTDTIGYQGDTFEATYITQYLVNATARIANYFPNGFNLTVQDVAAMQRICAYETAALGRSDFCYLFTTEEWLGFEYGLELEYYYDYASGNPTGRAQGLGYVQELIARLQDQYLTVGNSSVNVTLDNNAQTFPLGQEFYLDMSHDDILISVITALSVDYFRESVPLDAYPPDPNRHFFLSHLTPFGSRLVTEVIGCSSDSPSSNPNVTTTYTRAQNGYDPANAASKFIRMRWNEGIVPLDTIRGGLCGGRSDGMCSLDNFLASQTNVSEMANFQYACFGNYSLTNFGGDGTIFA